MPDAVVSSLHTFSSHLSKTLKVPRGLGSPSPNKETQKSVRTGRNSGGGGPLDWEGDKPEVLLKR